MFASSYHKRLYSSLAVVYMLPYIQSVGMGVTGSGIMTDLGLGPGEMGLLGASYLYAYAAVQLVSGLVAARFGPRLTLSVLFGVTALGCVIFASATSLFTACAGRALCGAGMAATLTGALTVFGRWFPPTVYGRITAWFFSIGGLGSFLATLPLARLNAAFGWQAVYTGLGLATGMCALLMYVLVKDWPDAANAALLPKDACETRDCGGGPSFALLWNGLSQAARRADFWKLCFWYAFMSGTFYAFGGLWAGPYLADVYGLSQAQGGSVLSMGAVGFVAGNPLLTWICENKLRSYRLGMGWACMLGLAGASLLVLYTKEMSLPLLYAMVLALGMAANAPNAAGYAAARNLFGVRLAGTVGGILGFSSFIGGACLQILCGFLLQKARQGGAENAEAYALAFAPFLLCAAIGAWASFSMTESYGQQG